MQAKYIFKVESQGINWPLGDVDMPVPKTRTKRVYIFWSKDGLIIQSAGTSFTVKTEYGFVGECENNILIPWCETTVRLIKEENHPFAEIKILTTSDAEEWKKFKNNIKNKAECFVAEIYELNSELHKCATPPSDLMNSYNLLNSSIFTLEKYYREGRIDNALYNEMITKWNNIKYLIACKLSASAITSKIPSDNAMRDIVKYIFSYTKSMMK